MSFARFSDDSHVYVFENMRLQLECCGCALLGHFASLTAEELIEHLREHERAGHLVPAHLFDPFTYTPDV